MAPNISFADGALLKVTTECIAFGILLFLASSLEAVYRGSRLIVLGISAVLSIRALELLLVHSRGSYNRVMFYGALALFILSTIHIVAEVQYLRAGFVQSPLGPDAYFELITTPVKVVEQAARITAVSLADGLTVWRLWGVWGWQKKIIVVPTLTLVATIVCAIAFVTDQNLIKQEPGASIFTQSVLDWTIAFLASSLATTWYCTGFIAYKLIKADRLNGPDHDHVPAYRSKNKWIKLLRILVESAALYSGTNLVYMVLYLVKTNAEAMLSGWEVPVASITFSLIVIRVNNLAAKQTEKTRAGFLPKTRMDSGTLSTAVLSEPNLSSVHTQTGAFEVMSKAE